MRKKKQLSIREKILKKLFPDFYQDYISLKYLTDLKNKNIKYQDRYIKVFEAIEKNKDVVLDIRKNKNDEWVIVTKRILKNDLWIMLYSPKYLADNRHPRIMSSFHHDYDTNKEYIKIDDIITVDENIGNGTICMEYFIQEIKKMKYDLIKGILSPFDMDHFDRSIHYYKKFGFDVELNEDKSSGSIKLSLK